MSLGSIKVAVEVKLHYYNFMFLNLWQATKLVINDFDFKILCSSEP